ncbi:MAG: hypothetical protein E7589_04620 [Ruminococcaceae bacterium]|nr:hypothetical protein [Oscillospiraceae bacterium]
MDEQVIDREAGQAPASMPFYKKWWVWVIAVAAVILAIVLFGGEDAVQSDLLDYINNDMTDVSALDSDVVDLYNKAKNSVNDYTMYQILCDEVIPKSKELIEKAEAVEIGTDEVKAAHELYLDAINKQNQALTLMLSALENQDYTVLTQANEKLDESRRLMRDYESELKALAKEHDVEINYN